MVINMSDNNKLNEAFENVDGKYIEKTLIYKKSKSKILIPAVSAAMVAAFVLITVIAPFFNNITAPLLPPASDTQTPEPVYTVYNPNYTPPEFENALFSMQDEIIQSLIPGYYGGTQNYKEIYYPNYEFNYLSPLEIKDTIDVFEYFYTGYELDQDEFEEFIDSNIERIERIYGTTPVIENDIGNSEHYLTAEYKFVKNDIIHKIKFTHNSTGNFVTISAQGDTVMLGNTALQFGDSTTDSDFLNIVNSDSAALSALFEFTFENTELLSALNVQCYNMDDCVFNQYNSHDRYKFSSYITVSRDYKGHDVNYTEIGYHETRIDPNEIIKPSNTVKMLSLETAEELLENGYCFGGHTCPKCMQLHTPVDFSDYDYVGLEYIFSYINEFFNKPEIAIPFYVFFEKTDEMYNGNPVYAKTYVPAIEISGLKEYFDNLKHHK